MSNRPLNSCRKPAVAAFCTPALVCEAVMLLPNNWLELLAQMDYDSDSPTNSASSPPGREDSALQYDMDDRRQARRAFDLAIWFLHQGSKSIDQTRGVGERRTKRIGSLAVTKSTERAQQESRNMACTIVQW
jgi:hypothetical protein